jgi:hypothetical protein
MPPAQVAFHLNEVARADFSARLSTDPKTGFTSLDAAQAKRQGKGHLIDRAAVSACGVNVVPHSKLRALKLLAQINGMLNDVQDTTVTVSTDRDRAIREVEDKFAAIKAQHDARQARQAGLPAPGSTDPV